MLRFLRAAERALEKSVSPTTYCKVEERVRPVIDRKVAKRSRRKVGETDGVLSVHWQDGSTFFFQHPRRYVRYMKFATRSAMFTRILSKYQDPTVLVPDSGVVIEVGANVGEFTAAAATRGATVFAFEPDPNVLPALRLNTENLTNVRIIEAALGDGDGSIDFFLHTAEADSSTIEPDQWTSKVTVPIMRLETFLEANDIKVVDFMKIEAEGAEPEVLKGCSGALKLIKMVAVDCGPERYGQPTFEACEELLQAAGFRTWRREEGLLSILFGQNETIGRD